MRKISPKFKPSKIVWFFLCLFLISSGAILVSAKTMEELIQEKRQEMDELQRQISEYRENIKKIR